MRRTEPKIGLITLDLRFSAMVRKIASELGARVIHVADSEALPLDIDVVIASRKENLRVDWEKVLYREDFDSVSDLVEKAVELSLVGSDYKTVMIAIDPGKNMGAVFMLDNKLIKTRRYGFAENLIEDVKKFVRAHENAERKYIVIGAATDFKMVKDIMLGLERALRGEDVTIIVSDESFTRKGLIPRAKGMSKDEYSALILSLKTLLNLK